MKKYLLSLWLIILIGIFCLLPSYSVILDNQNVAGVYYIDSGVTDQGAATPEGNRSIKDFVDYASGTTNIKLILTHVEDNSGSTTYTKYWYQTSDTIDSNIIVKIEPGAILDGAGTLTFDNPGQLIIQHPRQRIFDDDFSVSFSNPGIIEADFWTPNAVPGTTDMYSAFNAAKTSLSDGGIIHVSGVTNYIGTTISFANNIDLEIDKRALLDPKSGTTLTIDSPENIKADYRQQIFTSTGTLAFSEPGTVSVRWAMQTDPDGSNSNTTDMQEIITALPTAGGTVFVPAYNSNYVCNLQMPANTTLIGEGYFTSSLEPAVEATPVIRIMGYGVNLENLNFAGNGKATSVYAIRSDRANDATAGRTTIKRVKISNFTYGIYVDYNNYWTFDEIVIQYVKHGIYGRNSFNAVSARDIKISYFDYGITIYYDEDVDSNVSHATNWNNLALESPYDYSSAETADGKPAIGIWLFNVFGNNFDYTYLEGFNSNNAWPVIEACGPTYGVHGGGDNTAYLTDESGRDFTQLGVEVGMTVENITDGSTGVITAIGDDAAKNDKLTIGAGMGGGSDNDFDDDDRFLIDIDNELTGSSYLRNSFNFPQFANQSDANLFVAGYNEAVSDVQGMWVGQKDGDSVYSKLSAYALGAGESKEIDLSSNISAWAGYCIGKVHVTYDFLEGGAGTGRIEIRSYNGGTNDIHHYHYYSTSQQISGDAIIPINDNQKFTIYSNRAGTLNVRIHKILAGS